MARLFRRRRRSVYRKRFGRRARLLRRRMLIRKRIKRFVSKMGYPSYVKEELPPKVEYKVYQPVKTDFSKQVSSTHLPTYGNGNSIKASVDDNLVEPVKYKIYKPVRTYKKGACKSLMYL